MFAIEILALPSPPKTRKHSQSHPHIFKCCLTIKSIHLRHVSIEYDHRSDVNRNRRDEESNIGEPYHGVVCNNNVMGGLYCCKNRLSHSYPEESGTSQSPSVKAVKRCWYPRSLYPKSTLRRR